MENQNSIEFVSIPLHTLKIDSVRSFNIYIQLKDGRRVLYHSGGEKFTFEVRNKLIANKISEVLIDKADKNAYKEYLEDNLKSFLDNPSISVEEKSELAHFSITNIAQSLFESPRVKTISRFKNTINATLNFIMKEDDAISNLIRLTTYDYMTYNHSVNVGIFAVGLAKKIFGNNPGHNMQRIASGFFLHDIGKCAISPDIINKRGPLNEAEWAIMRSHPREGFRLLEKFNHLTDEARIIVMQHHERHDGKGYPLGLKGDRIHIYSKICCIADVFEALTATRPYKQPFSSFRALKIMKEEMAHEFDPVFFGQFVTLFSEKDFIPATRTLPTLIE